MIGGILSMALGVIGAQPVMLSRFTSRTTNAAGFQVPSYAAPVPIEGNVQPVPQAMYERLGLDWNKSYVNLRTTAGVVVVDRDGAGDRITYNGATYVCESSTDWLAQAGWVQVTAVKVSA